MGKKVSKTFLHLLLFSLLILLLLFTMMLSCAIGDAVIPLADVLGIIIQKTPVIGKLLVPEQFSPFPLNIVLNRRIPRVLLSTIVGAALAWAGVTFQGLFRNPLAEPYFVGVSAGAALGGTLALVFGIGVTSVLGVSGTSLFAFSGALGTIFIVYNLARSGGRVHTTHLILAGVAVSALLTAIVSLLMMLNIKRLFNIIYWTMGSFEYASWEKVIIAGPAIFLGMAASYYFSRDLNIMLTGEESAHTLGIPVERLKMILLISASFISALAVAVSGIIWFVGLIIPHMVRLLVGADNRRLLPYAALSGGVFLLGADTLARLRLGGYEIPIGVITALCGAPFFIFLLLKSKKA